MPLDASIFSQARQPQISSTNALMQALQIHGQQRQNALADSQIAEQQATVEERGRLRNALMGGARPDTPEGLNALVQAAPNLAPTIGKAYADMRQANAKASAEEASAGKTTSETKRAAWTQNLQQLGAVSDPASLQEWVAQSVRDGHMPMQMAQGIIQQAQQNPQAFGQVKQGLLMTGMESLKQLELTKPQIDYKNAGGSLVPVQTNSYAGTPQAVGSAVPIPVTQDGNNAATNGAHIQGIRMQQAGENQRAAQSKEAQFKIAGIDPKTGSFTGAGGSIDGLVEAVGGGKIPLAQATARMPPAVKAQLMSALGEKYPGFDPTDMAQRSRAAVAFGTGKEGNAVRSFNVSLSHLDTLGALADAMGNGSIPLLNQAKNIYQTQTGSPAPTDFNAAKKIVSDEIVKAIVGSGGGVADREEAAKTISEKSSPQQLKGVIDTYKELMRGQLGGLERQYQATTGRSDFRSKFLSVEAQANAPSGAASALPSDVAAALAKHGGK